MAVLRPPRVHHLDPAVVALNGKAGVEEVLAGLDVGEQGGIVHGEPGRAVERPVHLIEKARAEGHGVPRVQCAPSNGSRRGAPESPEPRQKFGKGAARVLLPLPAFALASRASSTNAANSLPHHGVALGQRLRVPLDPEQEVPVGRLHPLDQAVGREGVGTRPSARRLIPWWCMLLTRMVGVWSRRPSRVSAGIRTSCTRRSRV